MGDPKKIRKKYNTPMHPWMKAKIESERKIRAEFGTRNKKEIWKMETILKNFKTQAKNLIILTNKQSEIEKDHLFRKVKELGLILDEVTIDNILGVTLDTIMGRRLQTIVFKKGLARSVKQARQFIVHEHVMVNGKKITAPSYLVKLKEEASVEFTPNSPLANDEHPERAIKEENLAEKKKVEKEAKKEVKKPKKIKKVIEDEDIALVSPDELVADDIEGDEK
jgi:small subunit ribosomal protein S4